MKTTNNISPSKWTCHISWIVHVRTTHSSIYAKFPPQIRVRYRFPFGTSTLCALKRLCLPFGSFTDTVMEIPSLGNSQTFLEQFPLWYSHPNFILLHHSTLTLNFFTGKVHTKTWVATKAAFVSSLFCLKICSLTSKITKKNNISNLNIWPSLHQSHQGKATYQHTCSSKSYIFLSTTQRMIFNINEVTFINLPICTNQTEKKSKTLFENSLTDE